MDDKNFEEIQKFASVMNDRRPGISNIYVLKSIDKAGNVTDTKYGMNLLTTAGFQDLYKETTNSFTASDTVHLYAGSGVGDITVASTTFGANSENVLFDGLAATNAKLDSGGNYVAATGNIAKDYEFPIMYSPGTGDNPDGIITVISRFLFCFYPVNINNFPYDVAITEIGIGKAYSRLWTHAHIYNDRGEKSHITKKDNEQLVIYVYMCLSYEESVIYNAWRSGVYPVITTNQIMYSRMFPTYLATYRRFNVLTSRSSTDVTQTQSDIVDGVITNNSSVNEFRVLKNTDGDANGYFDGFVYYTSGFQLIVPQFLPVVDGTQTYENFSYIGYQPSLYDPDSFEPNIGKYVSSGYSETEYPPITDMYDVTVNGFNHRTGAWDAPIGCQEDPLYKRYLEGPLGSNFCQPIYYWSNNLIHTAYVRQNLNTDNDIIAVNEGHNMLFATDKYWDTSSWIQIYNRLIIPNEAKNCRYWITDSNQLNLEFTRAHQGIFKLFYSGTSDGYETKTIPHNLWGAKQHVDNTEYGVISIGDEMVVPDKNQSYTYGPSHYNRWKHTYGKWVLDFYSANNTIYCIDVASLNTSNPDFQATTRTLEFTTNVNSSSETYKTHNGSNIVCCQSITGSNECVVLKIGGNSVSSGLHNWYLSCCIYGTPNIAFVDPNDMNHIRIYDTSTDTEIGTPIELVDNAASLFVMFANGNFLWYRSQFTSETRTYLVDLSTGTVTQLSEDFTPITSYANMYCLGVECCDNVTMAWNRYTSTKDMTDVFVYDSRTPATKNTMNPFYISTSDEKGTLYFSDYKLRYVNNNRTLVCLVNRQTNTSDSSSSSSKVYSGKLCDMGRYLDTGVAFNRWTAKDTFKGWYFYGDRILKNLDLLYPVTSVMANQISGKTRTVTTINYGKIVIGKLFHITYTNNPLWGNDAYGGNPSGKPPGSPQPILGENGKIIGWS